MEVFKQTTGTNLTIPVIHECKDPSHEELKEHLVKNYQLNIKKLTDGLQIFPPLQEKYKEYILNVSVPKINQITNIYGNTSCSKGKQTTWHKHQVSLCPHHFIEFKRHDRYPYVVRHSVCNCKHCIGLNPDVTKCVPVNIVSPVLIRQACLKTGVFRWKYALEYLPAFCTCKQFLEID